MQDTMNDDRRHNGLLPAFAWGAAKTPSVWLDVPMLLARLYAGLTIASAGHDKLPTPDWMVDQVASMGFPLPGLNASIACHTEFAAGLMLAAGLLTRPAAVALAITMGVASFGFHGLTPILDMHIAQGFVWLFVVFAAMGGGRLSVDALLRIAAERSGLGAAVGAAALALIPIVVGLVIEFTATAPVSASDEDVVIETVNIAGTFNDWSLDATAMTQDDDGMWNATVELASPGVYEIKFAANRSWDVNLGEDDDVGGDLPLEGTGELGGGNIGFTALSPGSYSFTLDTGSRGYTIRRVD